jgi:hypothetical protein
LYAGLFFMVTGIVLCLIVSLVIVMRSLGFSFVV